MQFKLKVEYCLLFFVLITISGKKAHSQTVPQLGTEIYIEPGQTPEQIDHWLKLLAENKMPVARVFMMWNYLEPEPGEWDFSLYDALFRSAEKYDIKITSTLVPNSPPFHWGQYFFYRTHDMRMFSKEEYREKSKGYIQKIVERYRKSPVLDSWWLYNEPSGNPHPDAFAVDEFKKWLKIRYVTIDSLNRCWHSFYFSFQDITYNEGWLAGGWGWPVAFYDWRNFWHEHANNQIQWLRKEVMKYDTTHLFHTNPPGLWNALTHYNLPGMKREVSSLGTSLHPSWSFSFIPRNKFGLTVSYENGLLYGVTGLMPYWISELQAGNNAMGIKPMGPSCLDIAQWVWTSIGSGAKRVIFWLLNSRMQGTESNEWGLLNFQQQPSDRLLTAKEIASTIQLNENDFAESRPLASPITIVLSPQTLFMQERKNNTHTTMDAAKAMAHQKASMACYNALMQQGIPVRIKLISEFDWGTKKEKQMAILADVMSLSQKEIQGIEMFVRNGNKLVVTGLTGIYDENEKSWLVNREFPLADLFGGTIREIIIEPGDFEIRLIGFKNAFPSQMYYAHILPGTGKVAGWYNDKEIAVRNNYGAGQVVWVPSMIDVGAWVGSSAPLSGLLRQEAGDLIKVLPFQFSSFHEFCYMNTLITNNGYITVVVNGNSTREKIKIVSSGRLKSNILFGRGWNPKLSSITMDPGETAVIKWY